MDPDHAPHHPRFHPLRISARLGPPDAWAPHTVGGSTQGYAHNAQTVAEDIYGGQVGGRPGASEGYVYRGAGILQLTGRAAFAAEETALKLPLPEHHGKSVSKY
jgi:hypothetical protein